MHRMDDYRKAIKGKFIKGFWRISVFNEPGSEGLTPWNG